MKRDDILAIFREFKRDHGQEYGILQIGISGSTARDEAGEESNVVYHTSRSVGCLHVAPAFSLARCYRILFA